MRAALQFETARSENKADFFARQKAIFQAKLPDGA
jgi:hypothetical protein